MMSNTASRVQTEPDLSVDIAGVHFKNPVMAASGTFGSGMEYGELEESSAKACQPCHGRGIRRPASRRCTEACSTRSDCKIRALMFLSSGI